MGIASMRLAPRERYGAMCRLTRRQLRERRGSGRLDWSVPLQRTGSSTAYPSTLRLRSSAPVEVRHALLFFTARGAIVFGFYGRV